MLLMRLALIAVALAAMAVIVVTVDLTPRVESDFFFSTDDPQLATARRIDALFPSGSQIFIRVGADDPRSPSYVERIGSLTERLAGRPEVESVQSLTRGPVLPTDAFASPFWQRLLVAEDERATNLVVLVGDEDGGEAVRAIEEVIAASEVEAAISGVPYVVELVRRYLLRDLRRFSSAALVVFALLIGVLFRSLRLVGGMLAACLLSCAVTLGVLALIGVPIGVLTANLVTIVFVLTLSHTVFLASNGRRLAARGETDPVGTAVRQTFAASFWCMATTLLGFASLMLAAAKPMRELGLSGVIGAAVSIAVAYLFFPPFLDPGDRLTERADRRTSRPSADRAAVRRAGAVVAVCLLAGLGLFRLDTDPSLLDFFRVGTELRDGLEKIDRDGGSSPLSIVARAPEGGRVDSEEAVARLAAAQARIDEDPDVGVALSVAPLLAEARRASPMAAFATPQALLDFLSGPSYQQVALSFVDESRTRARYFLRMREEGRSAERGEVVDRLAAAVEGEGLEVELIGGLYELQGKLSSLIVSSLLTGLGGLLVLFTGISAWVSRSPRATLAMVGCLLLVPVALLGTMGLLGLPLDIISSPSANVAIAMGVDSMIHLATAARRRHESGERPARAWQSALIDMRRPIAFAACLVASGFGIFGLSSFPPTQRFGLAVLIGTAVAAAVALWVLPALAHPLAADRGSR